MDETYNKIIERVKELATISNEAILKIRVTVLVRKALNFMNRDDFPEELIDPVAEHLALKTIEETNLQGNISKVTEGDTTIEYNTSNNTTDEIFLSLKSQLFRFRKVGTV
nr:MAG TPA: tail connector protein [Caudoviricetes sp.]